MTKYSTYTTPLGVVCVKETTDGKNHRRTVEPGDDYANDTAVVKAACIKAHTPEVISAYEAHKAEAI